MRANYLTSLGIARVDLAVATHAHADHIGGLPEIFQRFPVARVWYNGQTHTTQTFERFIDAVLTSNADYREPVRGDQIRFGELGITVLHPATSAANYTGHLHDMNTIIRADFGTLSVIVMGDAEHSTERIILASAQRLRATVLQLGHHGSQTSSSPEFLRAVSPEIAVYQVGTGNSYGHPHASTVEAVRVNTTARVMGTDKEGTIVMTSNGTTFTVRSPSARQDVAARPTTTATPPPTVAPSRAQAGLCVDINTAPVSDLMRIIHIGEVRAQQLVALRPYRSVSDLIRINGIATARLRDIVSQGFVCPIE